MEKLTAATEALFVKIAEDAKNWNGIPLLPDMTPAMKGNLIDLKKKGLLLTEDDEDNSRAQWVHFTELGKALAASLKIDLGTEY